MTQQRAAQPGIAFGSPEAAQQQRAFRGRRNRALMQRQQQPNAPTFGQAFGALNQGQQMAFGQLTNGAPRDFGSLFGDGSQVRPKAVSPFATGPGSVGDLPPAFPGALPINNQLDPLAAFEAQIGGGQGQPILGQGGVGVDPLSQFGSGPPGGPGAIPDIPIPGGTGFNPLDPFGSGPPGGANPGNPILPGVDEVGVNPLDPFGSGPPGGVNPGDPVIPGLDTGVSLNPLDPFGSGPPGGVNPGDFFPGVGGDEGLSPLDPFGSGPPGGVNPGEFFPGINEDGSIFNEAPIFGIDEVGFGSGPPGGPIDPRIGPLEDKRGFNTLDPFQERNPAQPFLPNQPGDPGVDVPLFEGGPTFNQLIDLLRGEGIEVPGVEPLEDFGSAETGPTPGANPPGPDEIILGPADAVQAPLETTTDALRFPLQQEALGRLGVANPFDERSQAILEGPLNQIDQDFDEARANLENRLAVTNRLDSPQARFELERLERDRALAKGNIRSNFALQAAGEETGLRRGAIADLKNVTDQEIGKFFTEAGFAESADQRQQQIFETFFNQFLQGQQFGQQQEDEGLRLLLGGLGTSLSPGQAVGGASAAAGGAGNAAANRSAQLFQLLGLGG